MKHIVILISCFGAIFAVNPEIQRQFALKVIKSGADCQLQTNAPPESLAQLMTKTVPTSKEGRCFVACVGKSLGVIGDDDKPYKPGGYALIVDVKDDDPDNYSKFSEVIEQCGNDDNVGPDVCETGGMIMACIVKVGTELGVINELLKS